jgi:hypothetical protein
MKEVLVQRTRHKISKVSFQNCFCDNSYSYFIPLIKVKPNNKVNLTDELVNLQNLREKNWSPQLKLNFEDRKQAYNAKLIEHPYKYEINEFLNELFDRLEDIDVYVKKTTREISTKQDSEELKAINNCSVDRITHPQQLDIQMFNKMNVFNNLLVGHNVKDLTFQDVINPMIFKYSDLETTPFLYVDTYDDWKIMLNELKSCTEIAVDLEHHHLDSYLGILCLMQISSRFKDYVIDTIKLRQYLFEINEVFTNPNIIKVLHGSDFDVFWLQRDAGVYLVNIFDTGQVNILKIRLPKHWNTSH